MKILVNFADEIKITWYLIKNLALWKITKRTNTENRIPVFSGYCQSIIRICKKAPVAIRKAHTKDVPNMKPQKNCGNTLSVLALIMVFQPMNLFNYIITETNLDLGFNLPSL